MIARHIAYITLLTCVQSTTNFAHAAGYGSGWYGEVQASSAYANNLSRSDGSYPDVNDTVSSLGGGIGYADMLNTHLRYTLAAYIDYNRFANTQGLSRTAVSIIGELVYQPSVRYENMWYQGSLAVTRLDHRQAAGRDGYRLALDLGLNRHLTMASTGRFGYRLLRQFATGQSAGAGQSAYAQSAYDQSSQQLYAGIEVELVQHASYGLTFVTEYGFSRGDILASSPDDRFARGLVDAVSPDPVFASCQTAVCRSWSAYRNDGTLQTLDAGLVLVLDQFSVDLSSRYFRASTEPQGGYQGWQIQLGAVWAL
jgi:hypothetical protein